MFCKEQIVRPALLLTSLAATLLASELVISTVSDLGNAPVESEVTDGASGFMNHHSALGWIPRPNFTVESRDAQGTAFELRFNSEHMRGANNSSTEALKILVLGDSFTLASNLPEEETFASIMETELRNLGATDAKVANGGVNGYGTLQELGYYRYHGRRFDPKVVLLCVYLGNDFRDNMVFTRQGRRLNPALVRVRTISPSPEPFLRNDDDILLRDPISGTNILRPHSPIPLWMLRNSTLARLVASRGGQLWGQLTGALAYLDTGHGYFYYELGFYQARRDGEFDTAIQIFRESLHQLESLVRHEGAQLLVALIPSQNQVDDEKWHETLSQLRLAEGDLGRLDRRFPNKVVKNICSSIGVPVFDLTEVISSRQSASSDLFSPNDLHLGPIGHRLAAEVFAEFITQEIADEGECVSPNLRAALLALEGDEETAVRIMATCAKYFASLLVSGKLHLQLERWREAHAAYSTATLIDPNSIEAIRGMGDALHGLGDTAGAVERYELALRIRPEWWPLHERLAILLQTSGHQLRAARYRLQVERLLSSPDSRRLWRTEHLLVGRLLLARREWHEAEIELKRSLYLCANADDSSSVHFALAQLYESTEKPTEALVHYSSVPAVAGIYHQAQSNIGVLLAKSADLDSALHHVTTALLHKPNHEPAQKIFRFITLRLLRQGSEAIVERECRRLLSSLDNMEVRLILSGALHLQAKFAEAVAECETLVERHPGFFPAYLQLGESLESLGKFDRAQRVYRALLAEGPDPVIEASARRRLGVLLE